MANFKGSDLLVTRICAHYVSEKELHQCSSGHSLGDGSMELSCVTTKLSDIDCKYPVDHKMIVKRRVVSLCCHPVASLVSIY